MTETKKTLKEILDEVQAEFQRDPDAFDRGQKDTVIDGISLRLTCGGCPEQYDAFDAEGKQVGYLRLRHGEFTVCCPGVDGLCVLDAAPKGDGCFEPDERDYWLQQAIAAIKMYALCERTR